MAEELFILTFGLGSRDLPLGSIDTVARELHRRRQAVAGRPALFLRTADVWRGSERYAGGAAVSVRLQDGSQAGRGSFLAYVFMPHCERPAARLAEALKRVTSFGFAAPEETLEPDEAPA